MKSMKINRICSLLDSMNSMKIKRNSGVHSTQLHTFKSQFGLDEFDTFQTQFPVRSFQLIEGHKERLVLRRAQEEGVRMATLSRLVIGAFVDSGLSLSEFQKLILKHRKTRRIIGALMLLG